MTPGAMRKLPDYFGPVEDEDNRDDDRYSAEPAILYDVGRALREQSPRPDGSMVRVISLITARISCLRWLSGAGAAAAPPQGRQPPHHLG